MVSLSRVEKIFQVIHDRKPTSYDIVERVGLPIQKIELLVKSKRDINSIDDDDDDDDDDVFSGSSKMGVVIQ